ncbi:MAG TPA: cob(I)yrinic acid a,c-diamide adenosyltransferase [Ignavibacteriaceae bacterium]|nr:cob(I)yrinic acid a,c-diamide adenosyltransferase [Ignavibacteriaceae bacterium]
MKIYTKTGDSGETGLFGGERVSKSSARIDAYGTVDELNSYIGLTITEIKDTEVKSLLEKIQSQLFIVGSDLAAPENEKSRKQNVPRVPSEFYLEAEIAIDHFSEKLEPLKNFILPGGSKAAAHLHVCRTICRRAERKVVGLNKNKNTGENISIYLNRLSDLLFVLARYENFVSGIPDTKWIP